MGLLLLYIDIVIYLRYISNKMHNQNHDKDTDNYT